MTHTPEMIFGSAPSRDDIRSVASALDADTADRFHDEVWSRSDLGRRDRGLLTIAALIVRREAAELVLYAERAIGDGVAPAEIGEVVTHLAYYAGWGTAMAAIAPVRTAFARRGIDQVLPSAGPANAPLPLDEAAEARRARTVADQFGAVAPALVDFTTDYLFRDLWLRPGLTPRDRSLVTVAALVASGQVAQITFHLNRAMDNGLTRAEAAEAIAHLAFYTGWPSAMSALPVFKDVFAAREEMEDSAMAGSAR